jgi:lysylphosphatidylglycerol synthase-like protein
LNETNHLIRAQVAALRSMLRRHPTAVSLAGGTVVAIALAIGLAGHGHEFVVALRSAPFWVLGIAVALHLLWLLARSEAWNVCIDAAGGSVGRRRLYRASSLGYLGNIFNGQFGLAVRITALRRSAPTECPRAPVLLAAELPIVVIEAALAAICSFTLVGPLGVPWWVPLVCFAAMAAVLGGMQRVARHRREGFWTGIAVLRGMQGRSRIIALVCFAVVLQIARNWLLLNWSGVDASVLDSTALLIGLAVVGLFPVGPSLGAAAAVLILGTNGVAASAAAGALLTATAAGGALCFASWALVDRLWLRRTPSVSAAAAA